VTDAGGNDANNCTESAASSSKVSPPEDAVVRTGVQAKILHDETDGRRRYHWVSGYPSNAQKQIWLEALFVAIILCVSLTGIFLTWNGVLESNVACRGECSAQAFRRYSYFFFAGMLGSVLFGGKYLYHVVARGYWHVDRRLWRLLSPFLAASLALIVAAAIDSGILGLSFSANTHAACVALGFFSGYFADKALAKMGEIADVMFGVRDVGRKARKNEESSTQEEDKP
jgi:hypothetical protein